MTTCFRHLNFSGKHAAAYGLVKPEAAIMMRGREVVNLATFIGSRTLVRIQPAATKDDYCNFTSSIFPVMKEIRVRVPAARIAETQAVV